MDEDEKRRKKNEYMREFRAKNLERERERARQYRRDNPEKVRAWDAARGPRKPRVGRAHLVGDKASSWKGDAAGSAAMHAWIRSHYGTPSLCDHCGTTNAGGFDWANKDHAYKRDRSNWLRLCRKCHIRYDAEHNNRQVGRPPRKKE